jgi:EmrB/QacA subfamily drug resistance transporter
VINKEQQQQNYSKKWYILMSVGMGTFLATVDSSIVNVALPTLVKNFDTKFAVVQWIVLSYLLTLATLMLSIGRLADMIGKKPIYLGGMVLFTIGSLLCGLSPSVYWLIGFRILQAIGAAMMVALGTGILTEAFPPEERGKALGMAGGIVSIGIITGPTLGGVLIDLISWHWIFFVNIPVGIIGSFLVMHYLPNTKPLRGQHFDFFGAGTLFISLIAFLLALTIGQKFGFTDRKIVSLFIIWAIFFMLFLLAELCSRQPMVDFRLFKNILFSLNLFTGFISFVSIGGIILLMPFYLENVLSFSPHQVGLLMAVVPLAAGFTSPVAGMLSDRFGTRRISTIGLTLMLSGFFSLLSLSSHTNTLGYLLRFLPLGLGIGIFQSPNNSAIMGAAPKERLGVVSSLLSLTRALGQSAGIAVLGAFWVSRVIARSHHTFELGATRSDVASQVAGLHDTILILIIFISIALCLNLLSLLKEKQIAKQYC